MRPHTFHSARPRLTFIAFLTLTSLHAVACAPGDDDTGSAVDDVQSGSLVEPGSFANVTMKLPAGWEISATGDTARVGIHAGGPDDINLRLQTHHAGNIESLAPKTCPREGNPPASVKSVKAVESGLRPMGSKQAEYRRFAVSCDDGRTEEHQAWLLPISKIAIYEQRADGVNALVVSKMEVGRLKDVAVNNVTFHVPESWGLDRSGDNGSLGHLAGGPRDVQLSVTTSFTGSIDALAPKDCHVEGGPPLRATEVKVIASGLTQMDGAKAEQRTFSIRCEGGRVEEHRAWLLPVSKIAIFENRTTPDVEHVIAHATVR